MCRQANGIDVKCSYIDPNDQLDMSVSTEKKQKHIFLHNLKVLQIHTTSTLQLQSHLM